jgi:acetate---CoA ligase (ADP-forming) subunit beta
VPRTLSEPESKAVIAAFGVPCVRERVVDRAEDAVDAARDLGYPVVVKLAGEGIAHKTERGLVRLGLQRAEDVERAARELLAAATPGDGAVGVLVAPMVRGRRELIAGVHRDAQFGPCVMLGVGGVLAEAVADVTFRLAPVTRDEALDMLDDLRGKALLGPVRGEPAADRDGIADVVLALSRLASERDDVLSVDVNPLLLDSSGAPVAVDALVEVL